MAQLPAAQNATKALIDSVRIRGRRGNTLAMSTIGEECPRKLWLSLHWVGPVGDIDLRLKNLFATGTRAEDFIVDDLERVGLVVSDRQFELWGFMKHAHGFTDGKVENVPEAPKTAHLLEIKTHNDKWFKHLIKNKVEKGFPKHYGQCQRYMRGTGLKRTLYVGYNKNTSEYYFERFRYDASYCDDLERKEQFLIMEPNAPTKTFERSYYGCKFCDFHDNCHNGRPPEKNCRTCESADMAPEGKWVCTRAPEEMQPFFIDREVQLEGCPLYEAIKI